MDGSFNYFSEHLQTLETELVVRDLSLLKCRPGEVRPNVENTLFGQLHSSGVVSDEVAGRKAKYTQSSGTLSITTVLLIWKPRSLNYFHRYQKLRSEEN